MDPTLRKEQEAFKKRALALPTVESRPKSKTAASESLKQKPAKRAKVESSKPREIDYKTASGISDNKFAVIAKIVNFLKKKHHDGLIDDAFSLDDILDESQIDITARLQHWLTTEALLNNPKVEVVDGQYYKFKPPHALKNGKSLISLLIHHDREGLGGILAEEVEESLPHYNKVMKNFSDQIISITRPIDKKQVLFYNNRAFSYTVDEEIQKLWRSVTVEGVDERKIEDYLQKHDIVAMKDLGISKVSAQKRKKTGARKSRASKSHNIHLGNLLEDYTDKQT